jgi:hypothetical protein
MKINRRGCQCSPAGYSSLKLNLSTKYPEILISFLAIDGHLNPLAGMAVRLRAIGYGVSWYNGNTLRGNSGTEFLRQPSGRRMELRITTWIKAFRHFLG